MFHSLEGNCSEVQVASHWVMTQLKWKGKGKKGALLIPQLFSPQSQENVVVFQILMAELNSVDVARCSESRVEKKTFYPFSLLPDTPHSLNSSSIAVLPCTEAAVLIA